MKKNSNSGMTSMLPQVENRSLHQRVRENKASKKTLSLMMAMKTMKKTTTKMITLTALTVALRMGNTLTRNSNTLVHSIVLLKMTNHKKMKHQRSFPCDIFKMSVCSF